MVYLVDDDEEDIEIVQEALAHYSYKGPVLPLNNGKQLIDHLNTGGTVALPSVIILDLNMPLLDGFQALRVIRSSSFYGKTAVIILTSSSKKEDELKCFELGCDYFLTKPSSMKDYEALTVLVKKFACTA